VGHLRGQDRQDRGKGGAQVKALSNRRRALPAIWAEYEDHSGHGPTVDRNAVMAHRDMMLAVRDRISKMIKDGKTKPM